MRTEWIPVSASALVVGAMALVFGSLLNPANGANSTAETLQAVNQQGGRWLGMAVMFFCASVAMTLGLPAILSLFTKRARKLGILGVAVFSIGVIGTCGYAMLLVFFRALVQANRLLKEFRGAFVGKASPVHFFWGGADLATTRFSGRRAPKHGGGVPNCPDWVQELAYSHEVSSCGFWPGGDEEGAFYAYAYPEPAGLAERPRLPDGARYDRTLREFVMPYEVLRRSSAPDELLMTFLQSCYDAMADLAHWDRRALDRSSSPGAC